MHTKNIKLIALVAASVICFCKPVELSTGDENKKAAELGQEGPRGRPDTDGIPTENNHFAGARLSDFYSSEGIEPVSTLLDQATCSLEVLSDETIFRLQFGNHTQPQQATQLLTIALNSQELPLSGSQWSFTSPDQMIKDVSYSQRDTNNALRVWQFDARGKESNFNTECSLHITQSEQVARSEVGVIQVSQVDYGISGILICEKLPDSRNNYVSFSVDVGCLSRLSNAGGEAHSNEDYIDSTNHSLWKFIGYLSYKDTQLACESMEGFTLPSYTQGKSLVGSRFLESYISEMVAKAPVDSRFIWTKAMDADNPNELVLFELVVDEKGQKILTPRNTKNLAPSQVGSGVCVRQ